MLELKDLSITLRKSGRELVRGMSFTLLPGDRAAIIGEEGDGKSTLLRLCADPGLIAGYADYTGQRRAAGMTLGYLEQELPAGCRGMTPEAYLEQRAPLQYWDRGAVAQVFSRMGLRMELLEDGRPMGTLSGGESVKLRLAALLLAEPDALLLDEPTNDIDLPALAWLEEFLLACPAPVLYVSHDETLLERTANVILHLEQVKHKTACRCTISRLPYREYLEARSSGLQKQEQVARKERADHAAQMERWRQIYQRVDHEQRVISRQNPGGGRLLKKKMHAVKAMGRRLEKQREDFTDLPAVEELIFAAFPYEVQVPRGKTVLELRLDELRAGDKRLAGPIDLTVVGPAHVAILGANGAGKTTLMREICARLLPRTDLKAIYMPQDYAERLPQQLTPIDYLAPSGDKAQITRARSYLGSVKYLSEEMERPIAMLSGGQKAKLLFLDAVLKGCNVLLLDEPTRNFSPLSGPVIRQVLRDFRGAVICVTHDRKLLEEVCETGYYLTSAGLEPV